MKTKGQLFKKKMPKLPYYASLLDTNFPLKNLTNLKEIHSQLIRTGLSKHDFIKSKLISSYASCGELRNAAYIFSLTTRQPTFLYNTLMREFASSHRFPQTLSVFREMIVARKPIDRHTLPIVLKSCAGLSSLRLGQITHCVVCLRGFDFDSANLNALITMYSKCGDLGCARRVFDEMLERTVISWSAVISGYAIHGDFGCVFDLFDKMLEAGEKPDEITFTAVLSACSHGQYMDRGKEYFETMARRFGVKPRLEHYTCMVDMLGRAGKFKEAEKLIAEMGMEPDEALWGSLLGACRVHGKVEIADRVAEKLYGKKLRLATS